MREGRRLIVQLGGLAVLGALTSCSAGLRDEPPWPWETSHAVAIGGRAAGPPTLGDVDGDGHLDVVVPFADPGDDGTGRLAVLLGDGQGRFGRVASSPRVPFPGNALRVALGDVDGDGRTDAAVSHHDRYEIAILRGVADGGLDDSHPRVVAVHDGASPHVHSIALADVDGDGHLDMLAACADDNAVATLLGDGTGGFTPASGSPFAAGDHPYEGLSLGDVDGDDFPDVAVANLLGGTVSVLLGDGAGRFALAAGSPRRVGPRPGFLTLGHLDDDGHLDLVVTHDDDPIADLLLGDGRGGFRPGPGSPLRLPQGAWDAVIADVDGDGCGDVVLGGRIDRLVVALGDGAGGVRAIVTRPSRGGSGYVVAGELDGDDRVDLVLGSFDGVEVDILSSRSGGGG